jgi:flagellar L-ring protein precursor FlgH
MLCVLGVIGPLGGCSVIRPRVDVADTTPPLPASMPESVIAPTNGAIFQSASYRPLFEDYRARLVGDTLTVQIVESVTATATSTSSTAKTGTLAATITALPGLKASNLANTGAGGTSNNTYSGQGATANSNNFTGTITAVVRQVLPNGHLVVAGEKQIGINENVDVLRFSGQLDPRAIQSGNTVQSVQIANVRLEQHSRGQQGEAQAMGWLGRVFMSVVPF